MKKIYRRIILGASLMLIPCMASAQSIEESASDMTHGYETHFFATFTKQFDHNVGLIFDEEIRSAPSHRSHTTVALSYTPIPYLNIYAGYTLKLYGNQGWTDVNKFLRHRANVLFTGQIKLGQWNLSLREGVMMEARLDDVDRRTTNAIDWILRNRLQAVYAIPKTPISIVGKLEMLNTLNAPVEYLNSIANEQGQIGNGEGLEKKYGQYISEWRPEVGVQWKINKQHSLTLTYRYNYFYNRKIKIEDTGDVKLTNDYSVKHLMILAYKMGW